MIEGRKRILASNVQFTKVDDIDRIKEAYRIIQDSIYGFIKTNRLSGIESDGSIRYSLSNTELYSNYCDYCKEVTKSPYGKNVFIDNLKHLGFKTYRDSSARGLYAYCDRNPGLHWNKDVGNVYDEESEFEVEEKEKEEWKQVKVEF